MASTHNEVVLLEARLEEKRNTVYPDLDEDALFQREAIDSVLRQRELTHQELDDGIVDGSDDGGIDAVFTYVNGELVGDESAVQKVDNPKIELFVIQAKNEGGFAETPLQKLIDHLPQLAALGTDDDELKHEFNDRVIERFAIFRKAYLAHASRMPSLSISIVYVSKATQAPNLKVEAKAKRLRSAIMAGFPAAEIVVDFVDAPKLNVLARKRPNEVLSLPFAEQPLSATLGGMVALVSLNEYVKFITDSSGAIRETIFEENVRGYEGNTIINRGIETSLKDDSGTIDFWWLNNGITILGSRVQYAQKIAQIENPQIVNGLQTSRAIFNHFGSSAGATSDSRLVLVRIIVATEDSVAAQIIRATNSQNRVPAASLRAAEPFQRNIEDYLLRRGRYYERRRNYYKNQGKPRTEIIGVLELAQEVASVLLAEPDTARGRPGSLIRDSLYTKVFSDKIPLEFYWRCVQIFDVIEAYLEQRGLTRPERSNIRYHLARVAVALAVSSSRPKPAMVIRIDPEELAKRLDAVYDWVLVERNHVVAQLNETDLATIAKSTEFAQRLNTRLSRYSDKQKWPKLLSGWANGPATGAPNIRSRTRRG